MKPAALQRKERPINPRIMIALAEARLRLASRLTVTATAAVGCSTPPVERGFGGVCGYRESVRWPARTGGKGERPMACTHRRGWGVAVVLHHLGVVLGTLIRPPALHTPHTWRTASVFSGAASTVSEVGESLGAASSLLVTLIRSP